MIEVEAKTPEVKIKFCKKVTPKDLTDNLVVLTQEKYRQLTYWGAENPLDDFSEIYNSSISVFKVESGEEMEIIGICQPVTGTQINQIFYFGSPSDRYGLDTADIMNDWASLFNPGDDQGKKNRLKDHMAIPGMNHFVPNYKKIYRLIDEDINYLKSPNYVSERIIPVIRIRKNQNKTFSWDFSDFDNRTLGELEEVLHLKNGEAEKLMPSLGAIYAAAFTPEVRIALWKEWETHSFATSNTIGATQSWLYSLWKGGLLFDGAFIQKILAVTGEELTDLQKKQLKLDGAVAKWNKAFETSNAEDAGAFLSRTVGEYYDQGYGFTIKATPYIARMSGVEIVTGEKFLKYVKWDNKQSCFLLIAQPLHEFGTADNSMFLGFDPDLGKLLLDSDEEIVARFKPQDIYSIELIPPKYA